MLATDPNNAGGAGRRRQPDQDRELYLHTGVGQNGGERSARSLGEAALVQIFTTKSLHSRHGRKSLFDHIVNFSFDLLLSITAFGHWPGVETKDEREVR